jgi:muramoyltetrapeptide carboxypeptidase LdcA involved in peptidoglycan recycling
MEARQRTVRTLARAGDFSGLSAVLFGDAASGKRRDLATAA